LPAASELFQVLIALFAGFARREKAVQSIFSISGRFAILTIFPRCGIAWQNIATANSLSIEQFTNETSKLLGKDLWANPCRETGAGGLCPP
jgi:hypothetical protein